MTLKGPTHTLQSSKNLPVLGWGEQEEVVKGFLFTRPQPAVSGIDAAIASSQKRAGTPVLWPGSCHLLLNSGGQRLPYFHRTFAVFRLELAQVQLSSSRSLLALQAEKKKAFGQIPE